MWIRARIATYIITIIIVISIWDLNKTTSKYLRIGTAEFSIWTFPAVNNRTHQLSGGVLSRVLCFSTHCTAAQKTINMIAMCYWDHRTMKNSDLHEAVLTERVIKIAGSHARHTLGKIRTKSVQIREISWTSPSVFSFLAFLKWSLMNSRVD